MALAVDPKRVYRHITKADWELPTEQRTVFLLRTMVGSKALAFFSKLDLDALKATSLEKVDDSVIKVFEECIVGWENFKDQDGVPAEFKIENGVPTRDNWDRFDLDTYADLMEACFNLIRVSDKERKN